MNYKMRRVYSHRHGDSPANSRYAKGAQRLSVDMIICTTSAFSCPLVARRNDLVFGHSGIRPQFKEADSFLHSVYKCESSVCAVQENGRYFSSRTAEIPH